MAISNLDQVGRALDQVRDGLGPFVARVLSPLLPPGTEWTDLLAAKDAVKGATGKSYLATDPQVQLRVLTERLGELGFPFGPLLSRAEQNLAGELRDVRDRWAHRDAFSADDTYRALDTAERLLRAVGAVSQADSVRSLRLDVQRSTYESETRRAVRATAAVPDTADSDLPAWRDVLRPHDDVRTGTFATSEFAADLYRVAVTANADAEYGDPVEFFRRTYLTGGLKDLLSRAAARVHGTGHGDSVINLQDRFGGGKTHSMLAVWHLFSGRPLSEYPQETQDLLAGTQLAARAVRRVALVGNEISPGQPLTKTDGTVVNTLWGELAWQLGGAEAYAMVAGADASATNPGAALRDLLTRYAPAVILIDEWVAYARGLRANDTLPAGTFDTQFTFAQSLTQAVSAVPGCLLLVSVPASDARLTGVDHVSDLEVGGDHGREALDRLNNVIRRVAYAWEPATPDESFEIVRRRLFHEPDNAAVARINAVARTFRDHYRQHAGELPAGVTDPAYEQRIRVSYPLHPELLDRLYAEWSTLDKFQRTRGVLRLMSTVVHELWERGDRSPLIMPASVPLDAGGARSEVVQYLEPRWAEIVEADIDGESSIARAVDNERPLLGRRSLTLRVARTVFLDSAPTLEAVRKGVDRKRIALGVAMPGDVIGNIGSALDALVDRSSHFYRDGDRYWYDTQPSLNRLAAQRAADLPLDSVNAEVVARLRQIVRAPHPDFADVIAAPETSAEIPDDQGTRLVVLHPDHRHNGKDKDSTGARFALDVIGHRGTGPRLRPNTVVLLAADESRWRTLETTVRAYLAWRSIADDPALDLTQSSAQQARKRTDESNRAIDDGVTTTWIWGLHAVQDRPDQPMTIGQVKCEGQERQLLARVGKKLVSADVLRTQVAAAALRVDLDSSLRARWNTGHVSVGDLWEWLTRHPYLVRLRDRSVLTQGIREVLFEAAWAQRGFALATGLDSVTGDFTGLAVPLEDQDFGVIDETTLLVRPELATAQRERERERRRREAQAAAQDPGRGEPLAGGQPAGATGSGRRGTAPATPAPPPVRRDVRWTGRFDLDPERDIRADLTTIVNEIVDALLRARPEVVEIGLDISAEKRDGFDAATVRTLSENSRTLGATRSRFENG